VNVFTRIKRKDAEGWRNRRTRPLYLRKVVHPQAHGHYRVVLRDDGLEIQI